MSTEAQEQFQEDVQDAPEVQETAVDTTGEPGSEETQEEKPFRAWELPKPEPKRSTHVPYDRFREVNERARVSDQRAQDLETRNAELQAQIEKLSQVPDPDDIDPTTFKDPRDYLKARDKALAVKLRAEFQQDLAEREQSKIQQTQVQELQQNLHSTLDTQVKEDKNVLAAARFFADYEDSIHPGVMRELAADPHVGHVMVRIATDKPLLTKFFQSEPAEQVKLINRVSARIEAERELTPRQAAAQDDEVPAPRRGVPAALQVDPREDLRAGLPTQVKPRSAAAVTSGGMTAEKLYSMAGKIPHKEYVKHKEALGL